MYFLLIFDDCPDENQVEDRRIGRIKWKDYISYATLFGIGSILLVLILLGMEISTKLAMNFWLAYWTSNPTSHSYYYFVGIICHINVTFNEI